MLKLWGAAAPHILYKKKMKKIIEFAVFFILVLCSCSNAVVDPSLNEGENTEILQPDASDEENKKDDEQDEETEDKVYDDDVDWGPLS